MLEQGIYRIPLSLPLSLEPQREYLEKVIVDAQRRLKRFAKSCGWKELIIESFADRAEIFDQKEQFDRVLKEMTGTDPAVVLPKTYSAALENRVLLCVSPGIYSDNYPEGAEENSYEKLIAHEMAHRFHIRILRGNENAMGPIWFFEGFAIYAAEQFEGVELKPDEIWKIVQQTERGSYRKYGAVFRYFVARISIYELVNHAGDKNFYEWLKTMCGSER